MATLQNLGVLKYRDKSGNWEPLPVVLQSSGGGGSGGISTIISGKGQPTESTVGQLNQLYRDESTDKLYICTGVEGGYTWAAVVSDTEDAVTYTAQTLTEEQKTQARANIGAGTSNFSGSYNDLTHKPNIPAASVIDTTLSKSGQAADAKAAGDAIGRKIDAPQVAQVNEVLTVEEVDEDGKPIKWKVTKVTGTFVCTFDGGDDGWITCDKTVEEIITANNNGKDVIGHYYGDIYRLSTPFETGGGYGNPIFTNLGVGVLSIIQYDTGHFGINRIRLSDIAPEDSPDPYEVPVCVPTEDGKQWQYGRPLLATDYAMNELTDEEKALMQKNLGIDDLSLVKYTEQELTNSQQKQARKNIGAKPVDFPVTITSTTTDGVTTYTADKTFAEIKAAYNSGANVYAVYKQGIVPLSGVYNDISAVFYGLLGEIGGKIICNINIGSYGVELEHSSPVPCVEWNNLIDGLANTPYVLIVEGDNAPDHGGLLFYYYGATSSKLGYKLFTYSGNLYTIEYDRRNNYISSVKTLFAIPTVSISDNGKILQVANGTWTKTDLPASLPIPATAQVGQIVKVKSVDESGKITETETVDMPSQKALKWVTVHSSDLTEAKRELIISTDTDGKSIADYNPVGLTLIISTPADATQADNNGTPWVYPSATKKDNSIRVIGSIPGWKTVARDNVFAFYGGSSAMTCTGNVNMQVATYKIDGYALNGVTAMLIGNANHFPVGTHVEVSILCEMPGENEKPA